VFRARKKSKARNLVSYHDSQTNIIRAVTKVKQECRQPKPTVLSAASPLCRPSAPLPSSRRSAWLLPATRVPQAVTIHAREEIGLLPSYLAVTARTTPNRLFPNAAVAMPSRRIFAHLVLSRYGAQRCFSSNCKLNLIALIVLADAASSWHLVLFLSS
jgi:hypothetical protein